MHQDDEEEIEDFFDKSHLSSAVVPSHSSSSDTKVLESENVQNGLKTKRTILKNGSTNLKTEKKKTKTKMCSNSHGTESEFSDGLLTSPIPLSRSFGIPTAISSIRGSQNSSQMDIFDSVGKEDKDNDALKQSDAPDEVKFAPKKRTKTTTTNMKRNRFGPIQTSSPIHAEQQSISCQKKAVALTTGAKRLQRIGSFTKPLQVDPPKPLLDEEDDIITQSVRVVPTRKDDALPGIVASCTLDNQHQASKAKKQLAALFDDDENDPVQTMPSPHRIHPFFLKESSLPRTKTSSNKTSQIASQTTQASSQSSTSQFISSSANKNFNNDDDIVILGTTTQSSSTRQKNKQPQTVVNLVSSDNEEDAIATFTCTVKSPKKAFDGRELFSDEQDVPNQNQNSMNNIPPITHGIPQSEDNFRQSFNKNPLHQFNDKRQYQFHENFEQSLDNHQQHNNNFQHWNNDFQHQINNNVATFDNNFSHFDNNSQPFFQDSYVDGAYNEIEDEGELSPLEDFVNINDHPTQFALFLNQFNDNAVPSSSSTQKTKRKRKHNITEDPDAPGGFVQNPTSASTKQFNAGGSQKSRGCGRRGGGRWRGKKGGGQHYWVNRHRASQKGIAKMELSRKPTTTTAATSSNSTTTTTTTASAKPKPAAYNYYKGDVDFGAFGERHMAYEFKGKVSYK